MTHLYIIRHGQAISAVQRRVGNTGLSSLGVLQAERLRDRLAATGEIAADVLIASTLLRACQTAEIIAPALGVPIVLDEEVEVDVGDSPDVQVTAAKEQTTIDPARTHELPLVPGVLHLRSAQVEAVNHVDISNALGVEIQFELRLRLPEGGRVIRADRSLGSKNGRPIFRLTIPANETVTLRYQWQHMTG